MQTKVATMAAISQTLYILGHSPYRTIRWPSSGVVDEPGAPRTPGILGAEFESNEAGVSRFNATPYPNFVHELKRQDVIDTMAYRLWLNKIGAVKLVPVHNRS